MPKITLKDIMIGARQEAYRMRHYYVGVEHLFIALLEIKGSLVAGVVQEQGLSPEYVIDAIRRRVGKGGKHRLWAGVPNTPRAEVILSIANDLALENGQEEIGERDLLIAIIEEKDSMPVRVLSALGIQELDKLIQATTNQQLNHDSQRPYVRIDFGPNFERDGSLTKEQLFILRRIFHDYAQIRIERRLTGGHSDAILLAITPISADNREDASVVVKIDDVDNVLDEARRYDELVKKKLPTMTARIEEKPVAPEASDIAGIKYSLIASDESKPQDLRSIMNLWTGDKLGNWLKDELYPTFANWWKQRRPYRFQVWQEYDWLLPSLLTLQAINDDQVPAVNVKSIKVPIKRSILDGFEYGDVVSLENFIVQKVMPEQKTIIVSSGQGSDTTKAHRIEIRELDFNNNTYYRGEVIAEIRGEIWKTRQEQLIQAVRELEPEFNPRDEKIPLNVDQVDKVTNPIFAYKTIMDATIHGTLATIHGDLHPGNIMIGPNESAFLIDFAHARDGHTIFDWAMLETSILSDLVMANLAGSWDDARNIINQIYSLNTLTFTENGDPPEALRVIYAIRQVAKDCLANSNQWGEYFVALAILGLRALTWETMSISGRRLLFLLSALSIYELQTRLHNDADKNIFATDETDINTS
jgi:hypothetical protein